MGTFSHIVVPHPSIISENNSSSDLLSINWSSGLPISLPFIPILPDKVKNTILEKLEDEDSPGFIIIAMFIIILIVIIGIVLC